jgi:PAS domain S-box-containing protein
MEAERKEEHAEDATREPDRGEPDPARPGEPRHMALAATAADEVFDRLTRLATRALHAPGAQIALVDEGRLVVKSTHPPPAVGGPQRGPGPVPGRLAEPWASPPETLLAPFPENELALPLLSMLNAQLSTPASEPLVIPDLREHPLLRDSPAHHDQGVSAYAGVPLLSHEQHPLGAFCVFDSQPRAWTREEIGSLHDLAAAAVSEIERRLADQELHATVNRFRALIEHSLDYIALIDADGTLHYASPSADHLLGYSEKELWGSNVFGLIHPDDVAFTMESLAQLFQQPGASVRGEVRCRHQDGSWRWFEGLVTNLLDEPSIHCLVVNYREITKRKRVELALAQSEAQLQAILDNCTAVVYLKDLQGRYLLINRSHERLLAVPSSQVIGKTVHDLYAKEIADALRANDQKVLGAGTPLEFEELVPTRDGLRTYLSVKFPLRDAAGDPYALGGISTDITERKRMEEALRQQTEALVSADQAKDQFLAVLGHELRNPLSAISNAAQLLERLVPDEPRICRSLETIQRYLGYQIRLIDDLLDVSRISRGKILLRSVRLDLAQLAREAAEDHRSVFTEARLSLTLTLPDAPIWVAGDPTRLAQVMDNLLLNAAKFTDPGGRVTVEVTAEPEGASVTIADTGIGIEPDLLPHVFDQFTQADRSLDRSRGGLGLGLALVKGLIELHGGGVSAVSEGTGRGAAFRFWLPPAQATEGMGVRRPSLSPPARPQRILIVEDSIGAAAALAELLELEGHQVWVAHDGAAALAAALSCRPEVVLCDIGLPGMDGYEVARRLRQELHLEDALLIALTGYGQEEDRRRSKAAGFAHHLIKPVNFAALAGLLATG